MSQETETVELIVGEMMGSTKQKYCSSKSCTVKVFNPVLDWANRILAAHKREIIVERNLANDHITGQQDRIASLKSLVKELAHNLDLLLPAGCRVIKCENCKSRCGRKDRVELISKAREACK